MLLVVGRDGWRVESEATWEMLQRERAEKERVRREREAARKDALQRLNAPDTIKRFIATFADDHNIEVDRLLGGDRSQKVVRLKVELTGLLYAHFLHLSIAQLGRCLGGLDHTGIGHRLRLYCKRHEIEYPPAKAARREVASSVSPVPEEGTLQ